MTRRIFAGAAFAAAFAVTCAGAQAPKTVRISGTVDRLDGSTLLVKRSSGPEAKVKLADKVEIFGVNPGSVADVKKGAFIGVGAMPQPDGSQKAMQVTIFAESQRGTGEGFRPWNKPGTTMTNATVDTTVAGLDGQVLTVKYRGGEKKIIIGKDAVFRVYVPGSKDELKPGAHIAIARATPQADGTFTASRVNVGHNGAKP
jgi:hypothetical protein